MRKKQLSAPLKQNVNIQKLSLSLYNRYHSKVVLDIKHYTLAVHIKCTASV